MPGPVAPGISYASDSSAVMDCWQRSHIIGRHPAKRDAAGPPWGRRPPRDRQACVRVAKKCAVLGIGHRCLARCGGGHRAAPRQGLAASSSAARRAAASVVHVSPAGHTRQCGPGPCVRLTGGITRWASSARTRVPATSQAAASPAGMNQYNAADKGSSRTAPDRVPRMARAERPTLRGTRIASQVRPTFSRRQSLMVRMLDGVMSAAPRGIMLGRFAKTGPRRVAYRGLSEVFSRHRRGLSCRRAGDGRRPEGPAMTLT